MKCFSILFWSLIHIQKDQDLYKCCSILHIQTQWYLKGVNEVFGVISRILAIRNVDGFVSKLGQ